ncbi:hypothetical protein F3087_40285 [Nocardia colli]|uniref:Uncharacterized protein n=1 Tax=Nocardia colli TaxID=2545717 RepID=A0A5N0DXP6_9NOCA|nr:hypothetical protein [Nocardia colli]KAA8881907.1 hypothetical protein F3087_40285 [Nocardia colli]
MSPSTSEERPQADAGSVNTSSLPAGQGLSVGHALRNGDYTLTLRPGPASSPGGSSATVVLSNTASGVERTVPLYGDFKGDLSHADLRLLGNGALYLVNDGPMIVARDGAPLDLVLREDGTVVATSGGSDVRMVFDNQDGRLIELPLHHPLGESAELRAAIRLGERSIDRLADPLRRGHPATAPDVRKLLVDAKLIDAKSHSIMTDAYEQRVTEINKVRATLNEGDTTVVADIAKVPDSVTRALDDIRHKVDDLNKRIDAAAIIGIHRPGVNGPFSDTYTADNKIPAYVTDGLLQSIYDTIGDVQTRVGEVKAKMEAVGQRIDKTAPAHAAGQSIGTTADGSQSLGLPTTGTEPTGLDEATGLDGANGLDGAVRGAKATEADIPALIDALHRKAEGGRGAATNANAANVNPMASMMIPVMLTQLVSTLAQTASGLFERQQDRQRELDLQNSQKQPQPETVPPAAEPAAPVPAPTTTPPTPPASVDPPLPPPVSAPPTVVDMRLGGVQQQVSSVVAQAVNKEMSNPNGSDAVAAYAGTAGEQSSWAPVSESQVHTGDVAKWQYHTGVVVMINGKLHMIVNGAVVELDPHNPPDGRHGAYGDFAGFFHPSGVDAPPKISAQVGPPGSIRPPDAPAPPPVVAAQRQ